jgi:ATP-dependent DNA helicase RecQ
LVDDRVDSRWTLTTVGTVLLDAGSGAVHPFALAQSTGD